MSYARSPLLVCSTTMGTSMFCNSLLGPNFHSTRVPILRCPNFLPRVKGGKQNAAQLGGPAVQCIQGLLVADAMPNSIQSSILRQTRPHLLDRLLCLIGQRLQLAIKFLVADLNLFFVSNLLQD